MFVFWRVSDLPDTHAARDLASFLATSMANVTGMAQGWHDSDGWFRITLYYRLGTPSDPATIEALRGQFQRLLQHHLGNTVKVEVNPAAYARRRS